MLTMVGLKSMLSRSCTNTLFRPLHAVQVKLAEVQGRAERHEEELGRLQQEHGKLRGEHGRALDTLRAQCAAWQQQLKLVKSGLAGMEAAGAAAFALAPG